MSQGDEEDEELEDVEQVLFQGPMFGREANLKQNPRLVKAALVPTKRMISDALSRRSHTILLEPGRGQMVLRFVVDGIPYPAGAMPPQRGIAMVQMVKLLAGLNPEDRAAAQTGGINATYEDIKYELRVDTVPGQGGAERLRIRVSNPKVTYLKPSAAGMPTTLAEKIRGFTEDSKGLIIACGPPESGVTSLSICCVHCVDPYMYSVFNMADTGGGELTNVTDFEPQEGHDLEMSFDRIKRREADVIYMGQLTDPAVAQAMFAASKRLCFIAEMPARTPADAVRQLIEWVGKDQVAENVKCVVTQKLIRKLCEDCKQAFRPSPQLLQRLGLPPETTVLYRAPSPPDPEDEDAASIEELCEDCDGVPFYGRTPVYELLEMTEGMKQVIIGSAEPEAIRKQMTDEGMLTLQKDALRVVVEGRTALEEVQRAFAPPQGAGRRPGKGRPRPSG
ncbi:MAG: Flp pilus assembly complex ATPase component TadA [Planctomycetaceae bacterium]|nr:Flp pilus assembly complex ATPase component TadA [Planctomycetaceae bacterium]